MITVNFIYDQRKVQIQCKQEDDVYEISANFIEQYDIPIDLAFFNAEGRGYNLYNLQEKIPDFTFRKLAQNKNEVQILVYLADQSFNNITLDENDIKDKINKNNPENENNIIVNESNANPPNENNLQNNLIFHEVNDFEIENQKLKYRIKIFLFFLVEYIIIGVITSLGFFLGLSTIFISNNSIFLISFIISAFFIVIMAYIIFFIPKKFRKSNLLYIPLILYIPALIIFSLSLSYFIKEEIILCSLYIFILDILITILNVYLKTKFNKYFFISIGLISNIIILITFYFTWIKDVYNIIYIIDISIIFILYFIILCHNSFKKTTLDEYIYDVNKNIFCIFATIIGLYKIYNYIKSTFENNIFVKMKTTFFKVYLILLIEFIFIFLLVCLGFNFGLNEIFIESKGPLLWTTISIIISIIISIGMFYYICSIIDNNNLTYYLCYGNICWSMISTILFCFVLSKVIKTKIILSALLLLLLDITVIDIYYLIFKVYNKLSFIIFPLIINIIYFAHLYIFWEYYFLDIIYLSLLAIFFIVFYYMAIYLLNKYFKENEQYYFIAYAMNLSFTLSLIFIIYKICKKLYDLNKNGFDENNEDLGIKLFYHNILKYLTVEYFLIVLIILVSFSTGLNKIILGTSESNIVPHINLNIIIIGGLSLHTLAAFFGNVETKKKIVFL